MTLLDMGYKRQKLISDIARYAVLGFVALICIIPLIWIWSSAFKTRMEIFTAPFALPTSLEFTNIVDAWTVGRFNRYFLNSIRIAIPSTLGSLVLATMGGFATAKLRFPFREGVFLFFLFGMTLPFQSLMMPLYSTIRGFGLINNHLGVILPFIAFRLPFGVFFMRAFFRNLPDELMDSGRMDGCGDVRLFAYIMAPLAKPATATLMVFFFMMSWNEFLMPLLFLQRDVLRPLTLGMMFFQGRFSADYELIFAGITIITLPIVLVYIAFQRYFIHGLTAGALK